jgi:hypothetical protein
MPHFQHLGVEWDASPTGMGHGVGGGFMPSVDRWGFVFRRVSDPSKDANHVSAQEADKATTEALVHALEEARHRRYRGFPVCLATC